MTFIAELFLKRNSDFLLLVVLSCYPNNWLLLRTALMDFVFVVLLLIVGQDYDTDK